MAIQKNNIPYSKALYQSAVEANCLDKIVEEVNNLKVLCNECIEFIDLINNPIFSKDKKDKIIKVIFKDKLSIITINFLRILIKNSRIKELNNILESFLQIYNKSLNIVDVTITSACKLDNESIDLILSKFIDNNTKKNISQLVDNTLIGGYIIEFDNKIYDSSIKTQLKTIKNKIVK